MKLLKFVQFLINFVGFFKAGSPFIEVLFDGIKVVIITTGTIWVEETIIYKLGYC